MSASADLLIRNARLAGGSSVDVLVCGGIVDAVGPRLSARVATLDAGGRTIIPGLIDRHIHLLATAARRTSVDLAGAITPAQVTTRIRMAPSTGWVRAIHYDESVSGLLDRVVIDGWEAHRPVRIQDRTGALWMLNTPALAQLGSGPFPACVECDERGGPTGRIWRGDSWLRERLNDPPPSLASLSRDLSAAGITAVTDAGAGNGPSEAELFDRAVVDGSLLQRLTLMGSEALPAGASRGHLKLLYDEVDLPEVATVAARIRVARQQHRNVAAHCVTTAELLLYLAALEAAGGANDGDRIEHGSLIPESLMPDIARARLTVVTQPGFIYERGDRYRRDVDAETQRDLYRLASLVAAGIRVAAGSDAPYGSIDPWLGIRAAQDRRTRAGAVIGSTEALSSQAALGLYLPANGSLKIAPGMAADLCLLDGSLDESLATGRNPVEVTLIGGKIVHTV